MWLISVTDLNSSMARFCFFPSIILKQKPVDCNNKIQKNILISPKYTETNVLLYLIDQPEVDSSISSFQAQNCYYLNLF